MALQDKKEELEKQEKGIPDIEQQVHFGGVEKKIENKDSFKQVSIASLPHKD